MKLSSALALKNQLLKEKRISSSAATRSRAIASEARSGPGPGMAAMALGVTGKKGKYKLAVRIQQRTRGMDIVIDDIRKRANGEADVKIVGRVVKQQSPWHQRRNRPLRIGGSIGHFKITAGTLGCFVTKGDEDFPFILSNNHVLANENKARIGDPILQPGPVDGGKNPRDVVARLNKFVSLRKSRNLVDCAIAEVVGGMEYYYNWLESLGPITGVRNDPLEVDETVYKVGRTTGVTKGVVSAIEIDRLLVGFDIGDLSFDGQIEIAPAGSEPFSLGGDSGSLIVDSRRRAVGLLFAGNDFDATYANPIETVLQKLNVNLVF